MLADEIGSMGDSDDDETNLIVSNDLHKLSNHSKEGKLKGLPADVTYATFAGLYAQDIYDKFSTIQHFGHVSNRVLRKLYSGGYVDEACGNTLGKNRKVRTEQRKYFENLDDAGTYYLHSILKKELDADNPDASCPLTVPPSTGVKRSSSHVSSVSIAASEKPAKKAATGHTLLDAAVPLLVAASSSSAGAAKKSEGVTVFSKADLAEAVSEALKDRRYQEEQAAVIAREIQQKAHFATLQKQTTLAYKQSSLKFLQEQLKDTAVKLSASKRKEIESKVEELLATICTDITDEVV